MSLDLFLKTLKFSNVFLILLFKTRSFSEEEKRKGKKKILTSSIKLKDHRNPL